MTEGVRIDPADRIDRMELAGIPTFHAPTARRTIATLQFRVGRADEPFGLMGLSHLVEHLALHRLGRPKYHVNGFVDPLRTTFMAHGSPDELGEFLHDVSAALTDLPLDRLEDEARILQTEAMSRTAGLWDQLLWYRYGARGVGLTGLSEFGLTTADAAAVASWAEQRFTKGSAAIWIAGPLPGNLDLSLADGPAVPIPEVAEVPGLETPAWIPARIPGIVLGIVIPRESAPSMALRIVTKRLERVLRYEAGQSYEVSLAYAPLNAVEGHGSIYATCLDSEAEKVRDAISATVDQFAGSGPTQEEIDADVDGFRRHLQDPDAILSELDRQTHSLLVGHPLDRSADILEEMAGVPASRIRDSFATALSNALMMGALDNRPSGRPRAAWSDYPMTSANSVSGRVFDRISRRFPWQARTDVMVASPDGISIKPQGGRPTTVYYRDCVGLIIDGTVRTVYGSDGFFVRVDPAQWRDGNVLAQLVETSVPAELHAHVKRTAGAT